MTEPEKNTGGTYAEYTFRDGILYIRRFQKDSGIDEITEIREKLSASSGKIHVIYDVLENCSFSDHTLQRLFDAEMLQHAAAWAFVVLPETITLLNYFIQKSGIHTPCMFFSNTGKAEAWLSGFKSSAEDNTEDNDSQAAASSGESSPDDIASVESEQVKESESRTVNHEKTPVYGDTVLLYDQRREDQNIAVAGLLQGGFACAVVENKNDIIQKLFSRRFSLLLISYSPKETIRPKSIDIIKKIKEQTEFGSIRIIAVCEEATKEHLVELVKLGISGIIIKPFTSISFAAKFAEISRKLNFGSEQRQHIRVVPKETDKALAIVTTPRSFQIVTCKIKNISMGGISFQLDGTVSEGEFMPKDFVKELMITLRGKRMRVTGIVAGVRSDFAALKFAKITEECRLILSSFIYPHIPVADTSDRTANQKSEVLSSLQIKDMNFMNLPNLDKKTIQAILTKINDGLLTQALYGADETLCSCVYDNISKRNAMLIKDSVQNPPPDAKEQSEAARFEINGIINNLIRSGSL